MRKQSGFTLIEIAIVLVIIGLLLGGILKGQELINSAKVKNLAQDFRAIPVYIYGYQDKFRALPGDDINVATHVTGGTKATNGTQGNGVIEGNWNTTTNGDESCVFWQHVRLAGLAPGPTTIDCSAPGTYLPRNSEGNLIGFQSGTNVAANSPIKDTSNNAIRGTYVICSRGILGKFVKQLDTTLDDGNTATGSMMAAAETGYAIGASAVESANIVDSSTYVVCMGV
jgi:prepilin-type N-terminal cleavage/methylation domain-containing protein